MVRFTPPTWPVDFTVKNEECHRDEGLRLLFSLRDPDRRLPQKNRQAVEWHIVVRARDAVRAVPVAYDSLDLPFIETKHRL